MEKRDLDIITNSAVNWRMYQDATVLITGATGRLGRYILETLADVDLKYNLNISNENEENEMYLEAFDHYSNGCKVRYMLPNLGYTVDDLLNSDIFLKKVFYNSADVIVSVPKFEVSSELNIAKTLQALGVTNIFYPFIIYLLFYLILVFYSFQLYFCK